MKYLILTFIFLIYSHSYSFEFSPQSSQELYQCQLMGLSATMCQSHTDNFPQGQEFFDLSKILQHPQSKSQCACITYPCTPCQMNNPYYRTENRQPYIGECTQTLGHYRELSPQCLNENFFEQRSFPQRQQYFPQVNFFNPYKMDGTLEI